MIDLATARNDNEHLALTLLKSMEDGTLVETMQEICTEDFLWANSGLPTLHGQQAILEHMASGGFAQHLPLLKTMASFSADVLEIASFREFVYTERIDHHWDAAGRDLMTPVISGVMEIRDGKVCALKDYYDTECYEQEPTAPDPAHATA